MIVYISQGFFETERFVLIARLAKRTRDCDFFAWQFGSIETKYDFHDFVVLIACQHEMSFLVFKPDILCELLFRVVLFAGLEVDFEFPELVNGSFEILDHDGPVEPCFVCFECILVVLYHVHQVASPVHQPLLSIKIFIVMGELMSWPILAHIIQQSGYVPECFVDLKVHHIGVGPTVMVPRVPKTILIIRTAAEWPVSMDSGGPQIVIGLPVFLTLLICIALCRHPCQHQQIVVIYWFFLAIDSRLFLLFYWFGCLFYYFLNILSFYLLNLLYFDCFNQHWSWFCLHICFNLLFNCFLCIRKYLLFFVDRFLCLFRDGLLGYFFVYRVRWFFQVGGDWDWGWFLGSRLGVILVVFILVVVFVDVGVFVIIVFGVLLCILIVTPRVLPLPVLLVLVAILVIVLFSMSALCHCGEPYNCGQQCQDDPACHLLLSIFSLLLYLTRTNIYPIQYILYLSLCIHDWQISQIDRCQQQIQIQLANFNYYFIILCILLRISSLFSYLSFSYHPPTPMVCDLTCKIHIINQQSIL